MVTFMNSLWNVSTLNPVAAIASTTPERDMTVKAITLAVIEKIIAVSELRNTYEGKEREIKECEQTAVSLQTDREATEQFLEEQKAEAARATTKFEAAKKSQVTNSAALEILKSALSAAKKTFRRAFRESEKLMNRKNRATKHEEQRHLDNALFLKAHRNDGKTFIKDMTERYDYSEWKVIKEIETRIIWPHIDGILCIFFDLPFFLSQQEINQMLGYAHGNHHVKGALNQIQETGMLNVAHDNIGTTVYYLGDFALQRLKRTAPDSDFRPPLYAASLAESMKKGLEKKNGRPNTADETTANKVTPQKRKRDNDGESSSEEREEGNEPSTSNSDTPTNEAPQGPFEV